jgi:DNA invertase Pin-like site-specific DNA recombinase
MTREARRAGVYVRLSQDRTGAGVQIDRQEEDCRALCARLGWSVAGIYSDNDTSAYDRKKKRPGYTRMMADLRAGVIDAVAVYHLDRLYRRPRELEDLLDLCQSGKVAYAATFGEVDLSNSDGRAMARVMVTMAAKSSEDTARRVVRAQEQARANGKPHGGGVRPFGYESDRVTIRNDEAELVREAARRILSGDSPYGVLRDWKRRGITTTTGGEWSRSGLIHVLTSGRYWGRAIHKGQDVGPAAWRAILTPDQGLRLQAALRSGSGHKGPRASRAYPLRGVLRCGHCGHGLSAGPRQSYVCDKGKSGCNKTRINKAHAEAAVLEAILYRLDTPEFASRRPDHDDAAQTADLAAIAEDEAAVNAYGEALATVKFGGAEWKAYRTALRAIESRLEAARERLASNDSGSSLNGLVGHADRLRNDWEAMSADRQASIANAMFDKIIVKPGRRGGGFDATRLDPVWRA